VLKDRHAIERMQCEVAGRAQLRLEITERVRNSFVSEYKPDDMDVSAAGKTKYEDFGHGGGSPENDLGPGQVEIALQANHAFSSLP